MQTEYSVVYADPPWSYDWSWGNGSNEHTYNTLKTEKIKSFLIDNKISIADNAHLYVWTTNPHLLSGESLEVVKAWGFEPKSLITWEKTYQNSDLEMGMGYYFRGCTEHLIFAVKGKLKILNKVTKNLVDNQQSLAFRGVNPKLHSKKPNFFRDLIVKCSGDVPRIELFARERFQGWDSWGNELPMTVQTTFQGKCSS